MNLGCQSRACRNLTTRPQGQPSETFLYVIFKKVMKTKRVHKRYFILQYAWKDRKEINVQMNYSYIYQGWDIYSWSNFPNKPNKIPDVGERVFLKNYLILCQFYSSMKCIALSIHQHNRDVTWSFFFKEVAKICVSKRALNQKHFIGLKQALSNIKNTREVKKSNFYFS